MRHWLRRGKRQLQELNAIFEERGPGAFLMLILGVGLLFLMSLIVIFICNR